MAPKTCVYCETATTRWPCTGKQKCEACGNHYNPKTDGLGFDAKCNSCQIAVAMGSF